MRKPRPVLLGVAASACLAMAAVPFARSLQPAQMTDSAVSKPMLRLEEPARSQSTFNVGPTDFQTVAKEGQVEALYSCAATTLSTAFNARFIFDEENETVTIENLGGFASNADYKFVPENVTAPFKDGVITIPCSGLGDEEGATRLGVLSAYGMDLYLRVGKIEYDDNFMSYIPEPLPELKLYVSDDYSTIETRLDKGVSVAGVIDYMDWFGFWACSAACYDGMQFTRIASGAVWELSETSFDFGTVTVSEGTTRKLTVKAKGDQPVEFTAESDNSAFTVEPASGTVQPGSSQTLTITFDPAEAGEYEGKLTVTGGEKSETVELKGIAEAVVTDFSSIITGGNAESVTWTNESVQVWRLEDGQAVCRLDIPRSESALTATFTGNKPKRVTYDLTMNRSIQDHFLIKVNGRTINDFSGSITHTMSCIVPGGKRDLSWELQSGPYAEGYVKIGNVKIEEVPTWEGLSPDGSVTPLTAESFINIDGAAVPSGASAVMMLSLNPKQDSNLSFDYSAGASTVKVLVNEKEIGQMAPGESGTFHYDFPQGSPVFANIKVTTPSDQLSESATISNVRFGAGEYQDTPKVFNAILNSYLDADGAYSETVGQTFSYPVEITLTSGGKAIFRNLLPENELYPQMFPIEGKVSGNKISIPTWKNVNIATLVGYDDQSLANMPVYYNNRFWLVAGKISNEVKQTETLDELTFTISEDGKAITPDSDFGVWQTWSHESKDIVSFFRADSKFVAAAEGAEITASAESVDFGSLKANGYEYTRTISIVASGTDCEYSAVIEGADGVCEVTPNAGELKAGESVELNVTFTPEKEGNLEAALFIYSDGNDLEIPLLANVAPLPDYSLAVTEGKDLISFDAKTEYPWDMEENVAVSSNAGIQNSISTLGMDFTVPEGKAGILTLTGATCMEPTMDGFAVVVNGTTVYSELNHNENLFVSYPLAAGEYKVQLMHAKDSKDEVYSAYDRTLINSIGLRFEDAGAHYYALSAPYDIVAPVGENVADVVAVASLSDAPIQILNVTADGNFTAVMPALTTLKKKGETVNIPVTFFATEEGDYRGTVTVETSAGNLTVPVSARAEYVRYIGSYETANFAGPYVTILMQYGEYDVTSTMLYPASLLDKLKGLEIESLTFFPAYIPDCDLSCPDVLAEIGERSGFKLTGVVKDLTAVMTGEMVDISDGELTFPFDAPYLYTGEDLVFQTTNIERETFGGNTPLQISFRYFAADGAQNVVSLHGEADTPQNCVPVMRVRYSPDPSGIAQTLRPEGTVRSIEYHSVDGRKLDAPIKGLNVVTIEYQNGARESSVMLKK